MLTQMVQLQPKLFWAQWKLRVIKKWLRVGLVDCKRSLMFHKGGSSIKLINGGCFRPSGGSISCLINIETKSLFDLAGTNGILFDNDCKSFYLILIEDLNKSSQDLLL